MIYALSTYFTRVIYGIINREVVNKKDTFNEKCVFWNL